MPTSSSSSGTVLAKKHEKESLLRSRSSSWSSVSTSAGLHVCDSALYSVLYQTHRYIRQTLDYRTVLWAFALNLGIWKFWFCVKWNTEPKRVHEACLLYNVALNISTAIRYPLRESREQNCSCCVCERDGVLSLLSIKATLTNHSCLRAQVWGRGSIALSSQCDSTWAAGQKKKQLILPLRALCCCVGHQPLCMFSALQVLRWRAYRYSYRNVLTVKWSVWMFIGNALLVLVSSQLDSESWESSSPCLCWFA